MAGSATIRPVLERSLQHARFRACLDYVRRHAAGEIEGILGPGSLSWSVYRETVLLVGGGRALLLQLAHPAVAEGVYEHSNYRSNPLGRAWRTSYAMSGMLFGDVRTALRMAGMTQALHSRVRGRIQPETSRQFVGLAYDANDPKLKLWVYATLFDSALDVFERVVRPLSAGQRERLYQEGKMLAALNGILPAEMPEDFQAFQVYIRQMFQGLALEVGDTARALCASLFRAPWELLRFDTILTAGLLPAPIREAFALPWRPRKARLFEASLALLRQALCRMPPALRFAPAYHLALARIAQAQGRQPPALLQLLQRFSRLVHS